MPSKNHLPSAAKLAAATTEAFAKIGVTFSPEPSADLKSFRRGDPLSFEALDALPDDSIIWVTHLAAHERSLRINGAYRIRKLDGDPKGWFLDDGSSFAAEIYPNVPGEAVDLDEEGGVTRAFVAIPKKPRR